MFVYCIMCEVNGKRYIGCTTQTAEERFAAHAYDASRAKKISALHDAIRVYGIEAFSIEVIYEAVSLAEMFAVERGLIAMHGTCVPRGYNLALGGLGGDVGPEGRKKISEARRRNQADPEWRAKHWTPEIQAARAKAMREASYGPEWRARVSAAASQRWTDQERRAKMSVFASNRQRVRGRFIKEH